MSNNQVNDPITDKEIAFACLVLTGMTDRRAAKAVGLNPDTVASTKAKPSVVAYMIEHRAPMQERCVQQETEEVRRQNLGREQVLARLWEVANLGPEMTRNSMSAQIKALSMIVAIEGLIPSGTNNRRAGFAQENPFSRKKPPASSPVLAPLSPANRRSHKPPWPLLLLTPGVASSTPNKPDTWRLRL